ncbi:MAG: class I SAM-dependent methyltransferase [Candidatus Hydrogenedentota bacterium]|nr:MAG: class I SAM-dependent methyltransferase [Candidatus Hydrogenedentota bacterium]
MNPGCPLCKSPEAPLLYRKRDFTVFRCSSCTLAFEWPQLSEEASRRLYGNSYYESWGIEHDLSVRDMKKRTFTLKLRALERITPPGHILDVGCATGFFLEAAAERGWQAYGVEVNPYAVAQARRQFGDRVLEGTIESVSLDRTSFDAIAMSDVLEHVPDPMGTLRRAHELLRGSGLVAITTPNIASITAHLLRGRWPHLKAEHQFYFSPRTLSLLLKQTGFRTLRIRPAPKALSVNYIHAQRTVSRVPMVTPLASGLHRLLPGSLRQRPLYFFAGEMFAIGQKNLSPGAL